MIDNNEINVNAATDDVTAGGVKLQTEISANATTDDVTADGVKLQTEISATTKNYLRIESVRRNLTMGQLIDEIVQMFCQPNVPKNIN